MNKRKLVSSIFLLLAIVILLFIFFSQKESTLDTENYQIQKREIISEPVTFAPKELLQNYISELENLQQELENENINKIEEKIFAIRVPGSMRELHLEFFLKVSQMKNKSEVEASSGVLDTNIKNLIQKAQGELASLE